MEGALIDVNAQTKAAKPSTQDRLSTEELQNIDAYWRACNYLAVGMIYLRDNPLLREPLNPLMSKVGCWGTGAPVPA